MIRLRHICMTLMLFGVFSSAANAQQTPKETRNTVRLKMVQAQQLNEQGASVEAKRLVEESVSIMLSEIRNGRSQPWMREGLKIAMQAVRTPPQEIERIMNEVDLHIDIKKTVETIKSVTNPTKTPNRSDLMQQFKGLEYSPAAKEFAVSRRRASLDGRFLGQTRGSVGYRPIISFFPQGDMMSVGPVIVSPDRRYVRIGVSAAKTGIGHVHTFNFSTGEYKRIDGKRE